MRAFLFVLMAIALIYAKCSSVDTVSSYITSEFMSLFLLTMIVTVVLLALAKNFSGIFNLPQLDAWIKNEIREVIVTAVLFVVLVSAIGGFDLITTAITNKDCAYEAAKSSTQDMIGKYDTAYESLIKAMTRLRFLSSYSTYGSGGFIFYLGYSNSKYAGIYPLINSLSAAASGLTNGIFLYKAINKLLDFFHIIVPYVLFPVAFSFRAFPLTRNIGNTLIAISIGLAIFFPLAIIMTGIMNSTLLVPTPHIPPNDLQKLYGGESFWENPNAKNTLSFICGNELLRGLLGAGELVFALVACWPFLLVPIAGPALFNACFELVSNVFYPILTAVGSLGMMSIITMLDQLVYNVDTDALFNIIYAFLKDVNILVVVSYVDTLLIGLITLSGIRSISATLGGELYLPGVERLI